MNPVTASFAVAGLATLAAAGVVSGFLRDDPAPLEPPTDPLEDRRQALLRSLADLEEAHDTNALEHGEYARLRGETEGRMARVHRAMDRRARRGASSASSTVVDDETDIGSGSTGRASTVAGSDPRRVPAWAVAALIAATVIAVVVATLARDTTPTTQAATPASSADDPLAFFEQRVKDQPDDLAARLDLAHRYLDARMIEESLAEYAVALELDPDDAEAHAHVGIILYLSERPLEALDAVDRALATDPGYPEALFFRGVILLRGLDRPREAIDAFERYLDAAPFGIERGRAQELIAEAEAAPANA